MIIMSIIALVAFGLKLGIDFTGGSLLEIEFAIPRPNNQQINDILTTNGINNAIVQPIGEKEVEIRFKDIDEATHQKVLAELKNNLKPTEFKEGDTVFTEKRFDSIGPSIGNELKKKIGRASCRERV